jgi:hypothetical protein
MCNGPFPRKWEWLFFGAHDNGKRYITGNGALGN